MDLNQENCQQLANALLDHYATHGRPLPWRGQTDLYRIWISEIMLQQTGVSTVQPYYHRFLAQFPDVYILAQAPLQSILIVWQGLGYYQRAHNLHRAAQYIVQEWQGILPEQRALWLTVPGVGPSTASAILAIGRNQPHAILDGNVKRVLSRLLGLKESVDSTSGQHNLWQAATQLTSPHKPGDYAQAIMDLGATLCTRARPRCQECPWQHACTANSEGNPTAYPIRAEKKQKPHRVEIALLLHNLEEKIYFEQRTGRGLLASLWQPSSLAWPVLHPEPTEEDIRQQVAERFPLLAVSTIVPLQRVVHLFTHFTLTVLPYRIKVSGPTEHSSHCWLSKAEWQQIPMATLHHKVLTSSPIP
jgi:A/G-specific adenine glycosylase